MTFERGEFLRRAIQIPSHDDVSEMRDLLVETLATEGFESEVDEEGNVLGYRGDETASPHIVLNTHIDTVPPHVPYAKDGGIVRGRGACDAKGPLTSLLQAFFTTDVNSGRLTLAITPNEETTQLGGAHLGKTLDADGYIVGEPTGLDVCTAARGNFGGRITIFGESAHASDPTAGVNPIPMLRKVLDALEQYDHDRGPGTHELLGDPTLVPTHIAAGGPLNQIPAECTISFDRRTVPPETVNEFVIDLQEYLGAYLPDQVDFEVNPAYPDSPNPDAFATDINADLVEILATESGGVIRPFEAATEASYFAQSAPTVVFGPGVLTDEKGPVAHSEREYVETSAVIDAADALIGTVEQFVG